MTDRTHPLRMPPGWEPPVPAWSSDFDGRKAQVTMAIVGCQFRPADRNTAMSVARRLFDMMRNDGRANHVDLSECERDSAGLQQIVATGYWFDGDAVNTFFADAGFAGIWSEHGDGALPYGLFREVFNIPLARHETLHSGPDHKAGVAAARDGVRGPVREHNYWGSMRDRLPESATDAFEAENGVTVLDRSANRIVVRPNQNLAVIRSGQDLRAAEGREREEYFQDVEPNLVAGMEFLRDSGGDVHCFDCRFMRFVDSAGNGEDHTYGLAFFRSLAELETWAEHHPTHLAIFNAFLEFAPAYGPDMRMRLWHEVSVLPADNQFAEYVNCAPGTGLLSGL